MRKETLINFVLHSQIITNHINHSQKIIDSKIYFIEDTLKKRS